MREPLDMHAQGFPEPDDPEPVAGLSVDAGVTRWRNRPVVIEAWQLTEDNAVAVADWVSDHGTHCDQFTDRLDIATLEGVMCAKPGDWVIRGVAQEFYPCKASVFEATYEPADAAPSGVTRWTTTRAQMMDALRDTPHGQHLTPAALTALADVILARLPEASPDARDAELAAALARLRELTGPLPGDPGWSLTTSTDGPPAVPPPLTAEVHAALLAEIARLRQIITEKDGQIAMLTKGET